MSTTFAYDFFISRRGSVAVEAQEVADVLIGEGYKVVVQDYDFASSGHFGLDIDRALKQSRHLLIPYSHDYDSNFWTRQEFANFQAARAADEQRRIGLLRCDASAPAGLLAGITHGVLTGVADPAERRRIILSVAEGRTPAVRPTPRIFGGTMPFANRLFIGRDDLLAAMHAALSPKDAAAALTQTAVHGLGGVGKTSLAREYIERHAADYPGGVWWITAADRAGATDGLAALARALQPDLPADIPAAEAAQTALEELARRHAAFLLVFDNAPDPGALAGLLPKRGAKVLITSRHPGWNRQAVPLPVNEMAEDDAVSLLLALAGGEDAAGARRLARELGCLPLALDQAGAFVREAQTSFDEYAAQMGSLLGRAGGNPDYPDSVAATFDLAITRAAERTPAAEAVLGQFAWYAPERIPLALTDLAPTVRAEAIAVLSNLSLVVSAEPLASGQTVTVHRLVQTVMRNRLAAKGLEAASRSHALYRMECAFPYAFNEPGVWPFCRVLLPHARTIASLIAPIESSPDLCHLLYLVASFLQASGDAAGALPFLERALDTTGRVFGADHPNTLTALNNLAYCRETLGDSAGALPIYERVLQIRERLLGSEHPTTLLSMNNLAGCLEILGASGKALPLFQRALETRERLHGADHKDTLVGLHNLASCLQGLGDAVKALPLYRRAAEGTERVLGVGHPSTLASTDSLARCLQATGNAAEALPLYRSALEKRERLLGIEHPDTLTSRNNLAGCRYLLGDATEALQLFEETLDSRERLLGADHPDTLTSVNNLARCMLALGEAAAASPHFQKALKGIERLYGPDHPTSRTIRGNLEAAKGMAGPRGDASGRS